MIPTSIVFSVSCRVMVTVALYLRRFAMPRQADKNIGSPLFQFAHVAKGGAGCERSILANSSEAGNSVSDSAPIRDQCSCSCCEKAHHSKLWNEVANSWDKWKILVCDPDVIPREIVVLTE